jgi:pimeloyl-ACP methyl ester carboxylesterase
VVFYSQISLLWHTLAMTSLKVLTLADGRTIEYFDGGEQSGRALVFHHGTPGSSLPNPDVIEAVTARGLRYISLSRPGYGNSSRKLGRQIIDVVADTKAVLDALGITEMFVYGWSGGGPHALACAARLPGVKAAAVLSGVGPYGVPNFDFLNGMGSENIVEFGYALEGIEVLTPYLNQARTSLQSVTSSGLANELESILPPIDVRYINEGFGEYYVDSMNDGLKVSADGWIDDSLAFCAEWGFELKEIDVPVMIWQGTEDLMVPYAHGEWLAQAVPNATAALLRDEGHISILVGKFDEIIEQLLASEQSI